MHDALCRIHDAGIQGKSYEIHRIHKYSLRQIVEKAKRNSFHKVEGLRCIRKLTASLSKME